MSYLVKLAEYEGPLDLLLYLVRRNHIDIADISIAQIVSEYLEMIRLMRALDLYVAGEFLVTASALLRIKTQALLPSHPEEPPDEKDPRAELARLLEEYQRVKQAAEVLAQREEDARRSFGRPTISPPDSPPLQDVSLFQLLGALQSVLARLPDTGALVIRPLRISTKQKMREVMAALKASEKVRFIDLLAQEQTRIEIIATFLAILELVRTLQIRLQQESLFDDIWVLRRDRYSEIT
jgi:segregation and condensation protein A